MAHFEHIQDLLKPDIIQSLRGLELLSQQVLGAFQSGANRSLRLGMGSEFRQYRSYQAGDDLRQLDWKMYARSDRFYIREAELESHIGLRFVIDTSTSMLHEDDNGLSKLDYARLIAASLGRLAYLNGDHIALYGLNNKSPQFSALENKSGQLLRFLQNLLDLKAEGKLPEYSFDQYIPENRGRRLMYLVISDWYEYGDELKDFLQDWQSRGHEMMVFHLLAHNEMDLYYPGYQTFEDLETKERVQLDTTRSKKSYQTTLKHYVNGMKYFMISRGISYETFSSWVSLGDVLATFLKRRKKLL